jgi:hypothetical protein
MEQVQGWLQLAVVRGALAGLGGALLIDYAEFRKWKSVNEALGYDWGVAAWRWLQGAVGGALAGLGIAGVS